MEERREADWHYAGKDNRVQLKVVVKGIRGERTRLRVLFLAPTPETRLEPAGW